tara:strand:- start:41 stop:229 length:189 start_codon:yes stop_codon:yes gene_type:complete
MRTYTREQIDNLAFHAEKLVDYLIDDETKHYEEALHSGYDKKYLDKHIYNSIKAITKILNDD